MASSSSSSVESVVERAPSTPSPSSEGSALKESPSRLTLGVVSKFVKRYYPLVDVSKASQLGQFYQDDSSVSRAEAGADSASNARGVEGALHLLTAHAFLSKDSVTLQTVDVQESFDRSIVVLVQGTIIGIDDASRRFVQSLLLAVVPGSETETVPRYYVRHDILRFLDVTSASTPAAAPVAVASPVPVPSAAVALSALTTPPKDEARVDEKPKEVSKVPAAAESASTDGENKGKRAPRQPREPRDSRDPKNKKDGTQPKDAKKENKETKPEEMKKEEKPVGPTTWAQRVAKQGEPKPAASAAPSASTPKESVAEEKPKEVAKPSKDISRGSPKVAPKSNGNAPNGSNLNGSHTHKKERTQGGGGGGASRNYDNSASLVVKNVPYDVSEDSVRALLAKPAPEGYGLGPELTSLALRHGTVFLDFSSADHAQRVFKLAQNVKVSIGGRELRVESRQAKQARAGGAPQ